MELAALPQNTGHAGLKSCPDALVIVAGYCYDPMHATLLQRGNKLSPVNLSFA
jgi:hypothetical protein